MARKKTITSANLSMMDLISNALAGVIILFFILARARFPSYPPERVCGTLVLEFSMSKKNTGDTTSVYVKWKSSLNSKSNTSLDNYDNQFHQDMVLFDANIARFNKSVEDDAKGARCAYDTTGTNSSITKINDTINPMPALRVYQIFGTDTTKHIIVLHQPLEGVWEIGLLYNNHTYLLDSPQSNFVKINLKWYGTNMLPMDTTSKPLQLIAPTSRCVSIMKFDTKNEFGLMPDSTKLFEQSNPK